MGSLQIPPLISRSGRSLSFAGVARTEYCELLKSRRQVVFFLKLMKAEVFGRTKPLYSFINVESNINTSQCQAQIQIYLLTYIS